MAAFVTTLLRILSFLAVLSSTSETFLGPVAEPSLESTNLTPQKQREIHSALLTTCQSFQDDSLIAAVHVASVFSDDPVLDFSFSNKLGTPAPDADTVFRIGSISKIFTTYALILLKGIDIFSKPVTQFLPELHSKTCDAMKDNNLSALPVNWSEISIGALSSHSAGVSRDFVLGDLAGLGLPLAQLGLPDLADGDLPTCSNTQTSMACNKSIFLDSMRMRNAVFEPFQTPTYSNNAFRMLGYVVEAAGLRSYAESIKELVLGPLGLKRTFTDKPLDSIGAIPLNSSSSGWADDIGDETPSGGLYSSVRDLCKFGKAILKSVQMHPQMTRQWLKPRSHTSSLFLSVGAPWEIYRMPLSGRIVDLYSKSGGIGGYSSWLILVPDYGYAISVLTVSSQSGGGQIASKLANIVASGVLETADTQENAGNEYSGKYVSKSNEATNSSSIELGVQSGQPGLEVTSWISNGVNFLKTADQFAQSTGSGSLKSVRLYPAITGTANASLSRYRAVFETSNFAGATTSLNITNGVPDLFGGATNAWSAVDQLVYGQKSFDEFVFHRNAQGRIDSVSNSGLRITMVKI